ncbi:MAG: hypothetical protein JW944_07855 [Deltaproteobacteria bacterium]|nr:hypothetical protein [Deltaproteobacteria bacterium]
MKAEDYGYDPKTMIHSKKLSHAESAFIGILWVDHVGSGNKISAEDLAVEFHRIFTGDICDLRADNNKKMFESWKRIVRKMQSHLLDKHDNIPVFSKAGIGGGYWIAENKEEAEAFYRTFRARGLTGLVKATRGKQAAVVEAVSQLAFEFVEISSDAGDIIPDGKQKHLAPQIVDSLLEKMTGDPEFFAPNLRKIREKFFSGAILLEKKRLTDMQDKVRGVMADLERLAS